MPTQEILRAEFVTFFDSFSDKHRGGLITLEIMNPDIGDQTVAHDVPLEGITADLSGQGVDKIEIVVGGRPDSHFSDTVVAPRNVWLKSSEKGADEALEIVGEEKTMLLRFPSPVGGETR